MINQIVDAINEAAFNGVESLFRKKPRLEWGSPVPNDLEILLQRPIGIVAKNYDFMLDHIYRNIGNNDHFYDGYGTQIGYLANPFYNSIVSPPWFITDEEKNMFSNYIEYVKGIYGATLSVQNINEPHDLRIIGFASSVASIPTAEVVDTGGFKVFKYPSLNPNGLLTDTKLGQTSALYVSDTLRNAMSENSRRNSIGITAMLSEYYGLKYESVDNSLLTRSLTDITDPLIGPLDGHGIGANDYYYDDFINSLGFYNREAYEFNTAFKKPYFGGVFKLNLNDDNNRYQISANDYKVSYWGGYDAIYKENIHEDIEWSSKNDGIRFGKYSAIKDDGTDTLLNITNRNFKEGKYKTLIGKFKTNYNGLIDGENDITQTAISKVHGMSHGRNLLKKGATIDMGNGEYDSKYADAYDNPYCRVWTYHHQYHALKDLIRPFSNIDENGNASIVPQSELSSQHGFSQFEADNFKKGFENGRTRLGKFGVLNKHNGLVNISPLTNANPEKSVDIKSCMFSIENLAWKGVITGKTSYDIETLSPEQKGPFGGRIMWFPPYDLKFNESVNVNWAETNFIGRGESIYTYKNTKRSGTLSFKLLIDHPAILNYWTNAKPSGNDTVDDTDSAEQELLRFFAGCDFLTPGVTPEKHSEVAVSDDPIPSPNASTYTFFVFFPNNYSGVNDDTNYAVDYLINGYGTWKTLKKLTESVDKEYGGANVVNFTYPTSDIVAAKTDSGEQIGGYEMRAAKSINYGVTEYDIKHRDIGKVKYGNNATKHIVVQKSDGQDFQYYYRVDEKYLIEPLKFEKNYLDSTTHSSCLNSSLGIENVIKQFKTEKDNTLSFADIYVSLKRGSTKEVLGGLFDPNKLSIIESRIIANKGKIKSVKCTGSASKPGQDNKSLAMNRANTIKKWLGLYLCDESKISADTTSDTGGDDDVNSVESKLYRHVRVEINVSTEQDDTAQNLVGDETRDPAMEDATLVNGNLNTNVNTTWGDNTENPLYYGLEHNDKQYPPYGVTNNGINWATFNQRSGNNVEWNNDYVENGNYKGKGNGSGYTNVPYQDYTMHQADTQKDTEAAREALGGLEVNAKPETVKATRYEGEAKFFHLLELKDPFLHHKISEKIKYFDPAFHSISPEGFNARLTFLQQCARQGPTSSSSDANGTANNLAFGRQPVCILRVGDFYYTRIIIEDIQIDYDNNGIQWDLNPEGIGVMPMIANVNIRFNFIGGSSLAGPISRLQNALSFNMYANTEVYDDRAELAEYDGEGNITRLAPFNPSV